MSRLHIKKLVLAALMLALCLVLPFFTGQIPQVGKMLLPMHIPVLLCGFICGWPWAAVVGFTAPLLRSIIFTMPAMFPDAVGMAVELMFYGLVSGALYQKLSEKPGGILISLGAAMICGRIAWGTVRMTLTLMSSTEFSWALFVSGAFLKAFPGIILQLILIPIIVRILKQKNLLPLKN